MRYLLPFALAGVAVASLAGCAGPLITNPPKGYALAQTGGLGCARFADAGDTKIQIYCSTRRHAQVQPVSDTPSNCRLLLDKSGDGVESFCGDAAYWDEYDTSAVNADVTCRWRSMAAPAQSQAAKRQSQEATRQSQEARRQSQEICLTAWNWKKLDDAERRAPRIRARSAGGFGSPWGGSGAGSQSQAAYATSFGPFPAGGAIGQ